MKFKALFSLLFLMCFVVSLSAQGSNLDIIYLKDGKRVKGVIQNYVPNRHVEIMVDGELLEFKAKEVKRIINNKNSASAENSSRIRFTSQPTNSSYLSTEETVDEVHLKNGEVIQGIIVDIERG